MTTVAVCIGRFQPFHNGHYRFLDEVLSNSDRIVVGIGSAFQARSPRNPFLWQERSEMVRCAFSPDQNQRMSIVPLRDFYNSQRWCNNTLRILGETLSQFSDCGQSKVIWYRNSHEISDDACCNLPDGWEWRASTRHGNFDATEIRDRLLRGLSNRSNAKSPSKSFSKRLKLVADDLPPQVLAWLQQHTLHDVWRTLQAEWRTLNQIRQSWRSAPFPPSFVTVDAVVCCQQKVLLIRRGRPPGEGLMALPGGFVEQHETIFEAVLRELHEETAIELTRQQLRQSLVGHKVFDHPLRSQFGRVITCAHCFQLGSRQFPGIKAGDDARNALWVSISDLCSLEEQFHDDHFLILDHFLGLLG